MASYKAIFERLFAQAEISKLEPNEMRTYQESLKIYRDNYSALEYAEKEGLKKGREEGRKEGKIEGERNKAIQIAMQLKLDGMPIERVAKITGLSIEEIGKL